MTLENDPREEKRVVEREETVVPAQPVETTVKETETTERTETTTPASDN